jgi:hypothetical protein
LLRKCPIAICEVNTNTTTIPVTLLVDSLEERDKRCTTTTYWFGKWTICGEFIRAVSIGINVIKLTPKMGVRIENSHNFAEKKPQFWLAYGTTGVNRNKYLYTFAFECFEVKPLTDKATVEACKICRCSG